MNIIKNVDNEWEYKVLSDIIRLAVLDYETRDEVGYESAKRFLFNNMNKKNEKNEPINDLEWYLSFTDIHPDAIRRNIRRR